MQKKPSFDFWYAVNNTEVVLLPARHLETFGTTVLHYHMISELMDSVDQVRIREGRMQAGQPKIITPEAYSRVLLDGFGDEARKYIDWLRENEKEIRVLQYGYQLQQESFSEHIVTDKLPAVVERVRKAVTEKNDPLCAVVIGVDQPWDVCLIKLFADIVRGSAGTNIAQLNQRRMFERVDGVPRGIRQEIEDDFLAASRDSSKIGKLAEKLRRNGLFSAYEDRFFSLVKASRP